MAQANEKSTKTNLFFNIKMLKLCIIGIAINFVVSMITAMLSLPLYLDCIGTLMVAMLGGGLPAIIVAFLSNILVSFNNPLNLYYGIPAVMIAGLAAFLFQKGYLKKWWQWFISAISFGLIGSTVGTVIGWYTFREEINGVAAPLAFILNENGITPFWSQLFAETVISIIDKMITVLIVYIMLKMGAKKWMIARDDKKDRKYGHTVNGRMTAIVIMSVSAVSIFALIIGVVYYQKMLYTSCSYNARYISASAALCIDGDLVEEQFAKGEKAEGYQATKEKLQNIFDKGEDIRYLYVYVIKEDGCFVLYDTNVPGEEGQKVGQYVENDPDIYNRFDLFLAGGEIEPGYGNSPYGTLISTYTPVYDSQGKTVAYACADIDISSYIQQMLIYAIQITSFLFSIVLITLLFMVWYGRKHITEPILSIVEQTRALDKISPENWLTSKEWKERRLIQTDDELEDLYRTVTKVEENASINVRKRIETDEANKAKTDFLSRMSHDMRTPMNAIIGLSALTLDDAENPDIVRENMSKIRSSSDFLLGLVNDILDLAKIEDGSVVLKPEPYTYSEFLTNMKTMFQAQCDAKGLTITFQTPQMNPMIYVDKMRMNQIFFNVFSNAVKYTPSGGSIDYTVENLYFFENKLSVDYIIKDTGIGMSEEYQKHLFEPFVQENSEVTPELQGSGLGLSITKQLVDLMGGKIQITSKKNVGTTVRISMTLECLARDAKEMKQETPAIESDAILVGKRVLLAEDHPLNAQIARKLLEKKQMLVTHAENGKVALDIFRASPLNSFDLILMDIRMPEMSGLEATRAIRALDRKDAKEVVILAMSANAYPEDVQKSLDAGMNGHLAKPVDAKVLYQTIIEQLHI